MTLEEAKLILKIDTDEFDAMIQGLIDFAPSFIETATGMSIAQQAEYGACKIVTGFLVRLWFLPDEENNLVLRRTIKSLLIDIAVNADTSVPAKAAVVPTREGHIGIFDSDGKIVDSGLDLAMLLEFSVGR